MSIKTFTLIKQHNNWLHWAVSALFCIENEFWENIWISDWSVNCWKPWLEPSCAKVQLENLNWSSTSNLEVNVESSLLTKVVGLVHHHKSTLWQSQQAQIDEGWTCKKYQGKWRVRFSFLGAKSWQRKPRIDLTNGSVSRFSPLWATKDGWPPNQQPPLTTSPTRRARVPGARRSLPGASTCPLICPQTEFDLQGKNHDSDGAQINFKKIFLKKEAVGVSVCLISIIV